jgi:16S rRNA (uracil1498-N3)-methyltransferase
MPDNQTTSASGAHHLQRFFLAHVPIQVGHGVDLTALTHQLSTVLRLQPGTQIALLDGQGSEFVVEIQRLGRTGAQGLVLSQQLASGEPSVQLTLYQCSLKADKFEWVLQKGTELGVARFVPVISQRSIVRPAAALLKKYDRWQAILREAAEQCGRGQVPTLAEPLTWDAAILDAQGIRLLPWEMHGENRQSLHAGLARHVVGQPVNLLVGPEGGIAPVEADVAAAAGWQLVSLGPRILRAETAALASITIVMNRLGQMDSPLVGFHTVNSP